MTTARRDSATRLAEWLLTPGERGNPDTGIDARHAGGLAWTAGNEVTPLVHGRVYFDALVRSLNAAGPGDLVLFTDWRGDPDEALDDDGTAVSTALCRAAARGAVVKGLIWRSHLDLMRFSSAENRRLGREIEEAGGECVLDMRIRSGGSHHQKMAVVRYREHPDDDVAYVGGIDLCHSRRDDARHEGDAQAAPMPDVFGPTPPWHDIQLAVRGPAVGDIEATFRERWTDPSRLTRNPVRIIGSLLERDDQRADPVPAQLPDPAPRGGQVVQVLRTYPRRAGGYPFARRGERSVARAYLKALGRARTLVYLEDQYLWSAEVAAPFAEALRREPELRLVAVVPLHPDADGAAGNGQFLGRDEALRVLLAAGGDRVEVYGLENPSGVPVYVHAKVCVIDDVWTSVGSDNVNLRSWTHDSELSCAVMDDDGGTGFGRALRLALNREHLDRADGDDADLRDPASLAEAYRSCARALEDWYASPAGRPRPPGRLRLYRSPRLSWSQRLAARVAYRSICDPDGRPRDLRRQHSF